MLSKEIAKNIFYVGVNDRQKALFENLWPLPQGVSYNSYLIIDEKTVLIDTVDVGYSDIFLKKLSALLNGRKLDYLVVDHMEPDHSGSIRLLRNLYPEVQIVGNARTFGMLEGFYGLHEGLHEVKEGESLSIGSRTLRFLMAPMVHWPEVMFTYEVEDGILFSADAFGTYGTLDGAVLDADMDLGRFRPEMLRYYANIVGKYGNPVQKALSKAAALDIRMICPTHGPVWKEHLAEAVATYDRLSRYEGEPGVTLVYGSMYGHTEQMAEALAYALSEGGVRHIAMHNVSKSHASYILRDVFQYKGLLIGSPTYSNQLFPEVADLLEKIAVREVKQRLYGYFGSFTWSGAAVKRLAAFGEEMKWECVGEPVEQKQGLGEAGYEACLRLGRAMAAKINA